ncbi:uridine diphosphate-N-acetylglucosamine-binding protein YvcK [Aciditerrimonas ferrireducens]|uniref:Putative gluconeogenesis factor n=1 Tax=Aciditerrimonas ferrireducens TaxID=667306 RepID=A0ABV6C526_9ACTN|nr:uridine diphosphate-N-acetylglucosamine-binding protein YvcK [Aciditerrimonas ferrireducens]MCK4176770.1 uridine diphosphate-N-acetylglucosamine-binding protein YvcK [Aciditerrimonas ferrireducens]
MSPLDEAATGPAVVAVGGGHGQAATLRAARRYAGSVTAVVSLADDGGSSGRLRASLGLPPLGDLRTCLVALAAQDSALAAACQHRFPAEALLGSTPPGGQSPASSGPGHPLGNLLLAALATVTGDLQAALDEAGRLLGCEGRVVPASAGPVTLVAETPDGPVEGQVAVMGTSRIRRVRLAPPDPPASEAALEAIRQADQVVLGPGSLFTSVLAAAIVPGIAEALRSTRAQRVYVANLRPQVAETAGYDVAAHVAAIRAHGIPVDVVLADTSHIPLGEPGVPVVERPLADRPGHAHDPEQLAKALVDLLG